MRVVLQRVSEARVRVADRLVGEIGVGLLLLVGIARQDGPEDVRHVVDKVSHLRVFTGVDSNRFDRSVAEVKGSVLVVSQYTLCADVRRGRRPSFDGAAPPAEARVVFDDLVRELRATGLPVATGEFQATMSVESVNDGPSR